MAKNNKYQIHLLQVDSKWQAQITRQVTSKKTTVTKQHDDFACEADAKKWADTELEQLLEMQVSSNQRQNKQRKQKADIAEQRSSRRAKKTALAKAEKENKEKLVKEQKIITDSNSNINLELDDEVNYDFDSSE